jgi:hypothetical protein
VYDEGSIRDSENRSGMYSEVAWGNAAPGKGDSTSTIELRGGGSVSNGHAGARDSTETPRRTVHYACRSTLRWCPGNLGKRESMSGGSQTPTQTLLFAGSGTRSREPGAQSWAEDLLWHDRNRSKLTMEQYISWTARSDSRPDGSASGLGGSFGFGSNYMQAAKDKEMIEVEGARDWLTG